MSMVTSKGQVTLPKKLRDALGLKGGSEVEFELDSGRIVIRKRAPTAVLVRWRGRYAGELAGGTVDETMELLRGERPDGDGEPG